MNLPSFDEFYEMLTLAVERIPDHFLQSLSGGFNLQEEKKQEGEFYILGEYIEDYQLGCFIVFYYGSFKSMLCNEPLSVWENEIMDTVVHELQHHLESLAGRDDLAQKEIEELYAALRSQN